MEPTRTVATKKKVCIITCYRQPDYIRAKTLREALSALEGVKLIILKNRHTGILRYLEIMAKTILTRISQHPDIYILTFRGYEMLIPIRIITTGKKMIFDEFINPIEQVIYEHNKYKREGLIHRALRKGYRSWLNMADAIITDTQSHADLSSQMMDIPIAKYTPLIVSTDEKTFKPRSKKDRAQSKKLNIFYYGSMLPLHGINVVLEALLSIRGGGIKLTIIGGNKQVEEKVIGARSRGLDVRYKSWVNFNKLPAYINKSDLCLAGPFGDTFQSQYVITGKAYQFLCMKRPIVVGKNKESQIFTHKKNALVIKQGSPEELAKTIEWARDNRRELRSIGIEGYELYQEKLSNKVLSTEIGKLLSGL